MTVPISRYFHGAGEKVMSSMKKQYGAERGKEVFYATVAKKRQKPGKKVLDGLKSAKPK